MEFYENCDGELKAIDNELENLREKAKNVRNRYITLLAENLKRDHTLNELKKKN